MKSLILSLSLVFVSSIVFSQTPDCNAINVTGGNGSINVSGLSGAAIAGIQVFNSSWASVFSQTYNNPPNSITVSPLTAGQYFVNVRFYTSTWSVICEKGVYATVAAGSTQDTCSTTFQKTYGDPAVDEQAFDIIKSGDGGYVIAGESAASGTTNYNALLMKVDQHGNLLWSKTYGGAQNDFFRRVRRTTDGGFIAFGQTSSFGNAYDFWVVKTDANGNVLWQKRYTDNISPKIAFNLTTTSDGGFAVIGDDPYEPYGGGSSNWIVIKADASGNIQWQKSLGTGDGIGIIEDNHGSAGLVAVGHNSSNTTYDGNLTKLDITNGNVLWTKSYDFDGRTNRLGDIYAVSDGFLINGVNSDGYGVTNPVHMEVKTDFDGNVLWAKEYKANPSSWNGISTSLPDGGFAISLSDPSTDPSFNRDIHLIRADASGNITWTKKFSQPGQQEIDMLVNDGNYIVGAGYSKTGSYNDIILVRTDLSGNMGSCPSANETGTTRTPAKTNINWTWPINTVRNNSAVNTTSATNTTTPATTILCADTCVVPPPTVSIGNVTVNENAGSATLQICLSAPYSQAVTVQYTTVNGTATAGSDYTASNGTATIAAGQSCTTVSIPIINDATSESTENFTVNLSNPVNATIGNGSGIVTINDDDQSQYNCNNIGFVPGNQSIKIGGILAPVATVQVFNNSWATVFNQTYTSAPDTVVVPVAPGTYHVKVTFYNSGWAYICDKSQDVNVTNQCPAGYICIFNTCPSQSVNLNDAYSIPNLPSGTVVSWHTATPATDANRLTNAQAQNVTTSGTYYAAINISGNNCYSNTIPVMVTISTCSSTSAISEVQVKNLNDESGSKIVVSPNPFTTSVKVIIESDKNNKASLILTDMMGRTIRSKQVQLNAGRNLFSVDDLGGLPSGNYFLRVTSVDGLQTFKLIRQQ